MKNMKTMYNKVMKSIEAVMIIITKMTTMKRKIKTREKRMMIII